jgi:hypothetical protein
MWDLTTSLYHQAEQQGRWNTNGRKLVYFEIQDNKGRKIALECTIEGMHRKEVFDSTGQWHIWAYCHAIFISVKVRNKSTRRYDGNAPFGAGKGRGWHECCLDTDCRGVPDIYFVYSATTRKGRAYLVRHREFDKKGKHILREFAFKPDGTFGNFVKPD